MRARAEAATTGPWRTWNDGHVGSPTVHIGGGVMPTPGSDPAQRMPDAEFIANAREDVPALLDALDAAEAEVGRLRESTSFGMYVSMQAERDAARAREAALRERVAHIIDRYGDAHDAKDCAVLHDLRALAVDGAGQEGRHG